jgi:hypothetical protein
LIKHSILLFLKEFQPLHLTGRAVTLSRGFMVLRPVPQVNWSIRQRASVTSTDVT